MRRILLVMLSVLFAVTLALGITACGSKDGAKYTISFNTGIEKTVEPRTYIVGEQFELPILEWYGKEFEGWCYDKECTKPVETVRKLGKLYAKTLDVKGDATLYAKWGDPNYRITFEIGKSEEEFEGQFDDLPVAIGVTVQLPQPKPLVRGGNSYPFSYWLHQASGQKYTTEFTLTIGENVTLRPIYDFGVRSAFEVDEEGRYYLANATTSATEINGLEMACGTLEGDITIEDFTNTGAGLIWNVRLPEDKANPINNDGSEYFYFHVNSSSFALQLAWVREDAATGYASVHIFSDNAPAQLKEDWQAAKEAKTPFTYHVKVVTTPTSFELFLGHDADDATRVFLFNNFNTTYPGGQPFPKPGLSGLGVGFRTNGKGVYFSNIKVTKVTHYQVSLDVNGGVLEGNPYLRIEKAAAVVKDSLPVPTRAGYEFKGWCLENGDEYEGTDSLGENITLVAKWEQVKGGALIEFEDEESFDSMYYESGAAANSQELPAPTRRGFTFDGWYNGTQKVEDSTVFAEVGYDGVPKNITLTSHWKKADDVMVTEGINITKITGSDYEKNEAYGEADSVGKKYTSFKANAQSIGIVDGKELEEGRFTVYAKLPASGANGLVFGATFNDFQGSSSTDYMSEGSSYYYWHLNCQSGAWQFAKVTNKSNIHTTNDGYDVISSGAIAGFKPGLRHVFVVEMSNTVGGGRLFVLSMDGTVVSTARDDGTKGGPVLMGKSFGFRNAAGGPEYYGLLVETAEDLAAGTEGVTYKLDPNGGTLNGGQSVVDYKRVNGWDLLLPTPTPTEDNTFVGWTTTKNDGSTLFNKTVVDIADNNKELFAYYIGSGRALVTFDANGGKVAESFKVVDEGDLVEDLPAASRPGYKFGGWWHDGTEYKRGTNVTGNVTVTAKWEAVSEGPFAKLQNVEKRGSFTKGRDAADLYDVYTPDQAAIALIQDAEAGKTIKKQTISYFVKFSATGRLGIIFGGNGLNEIGKTTLDVTASNTFTGYYWYLNPEAGNGGSILYKYETGKEYSRLQDVIPFQNKYGSAWVAESTYEFKVEITWNSDTEARIKLYVDGREFADKTDNSAHRYAQIGWRNEANDGKSQIFGIRIENEYEEALASSLPIDAIDLFVEVKK